MIDLASSMRFVASSILGYLVVDFAHIGLECMRLLWTQFSSSLISMDLVGLRVPEFWPMNIGSSVECCLLGKSEGHSYDHNKLNFGDSLQLRRQYRNFQCILGWCEFLSREHKSSKEDNKILLLPFTKSFTFWFSSIHSIPTWIEVRVRGLATTFLDLSYTYARFCDMKRHIKDWGLRVSTARNLVWSLDNKFVTSLR